MFLLTGKTKERCHMTCILLRILWRNLSSRLYCANKLYRTLSECTLSGSIILFNRQQFQASGTTVLHLVTVTYEVHRHYNCQQEQRPIDEPAEFTLASVHGGSKNLCWCLKNPGLFIKSGRMKMSGGSAVISRHESTVLSHLGVFRF